MLNPGYTTISKFLIEQVGKQLRAMMPWAEEGKGAAGESAAPKEPSLRRPAAPASATR